MPDASVTPRVTVKPGDTVTLLEPDYKYGRGTVVLRISRVRLDINKWYDSQWVWLEGVPIRWDGTEDRPRVLLARVSALPLRAS